MYKNYDQQIFNDSFHKHHCHYIICNNGCVIAIRYWCMLLTLVFHYYHYCYFYSLSLSLSLLLYIIIIITIILSLGHNITIVATITITITIAFAIKQLYLQYYLLMRTFLINLLSISLLYHCHHNHYQFLP